MENRAVILRKESQEYILNSLNHQIDILLPIKHSYANLQHYHIKISKDLETLLEQHKQISMIVFEKLKQQNALESELDCNRTALEGQLKACDKQFAKQTLDHKNLLSHSESLNSKCNLQSDQKITLTNRIRQLQDSNRKLLTNIQNFEKNLREIQQEIYAKKSQLQNIENQIMERKAINDRMNFTNQNLQHDLQKLGQKNKRLAGDNKNIDNQINELQTKAQKKQRENRQQAENIIQKSNQLDKIKNENQYYSKMLKGQQTAGQILASNQNRVEELIDARKTEVSRVEKQNCQLMRAIKEETGNLKKNNVSKQALETHLSSLLEMNNLILSHMQQWCLEDRNTIKVIEAKADRLSLVVNRSRGIIFEQKRVLQPSNFSNYAGTNQNNKSREQIRTGKSWNSTRANWREDIENYR